MTKKSLSPLKMKTLIASLQCKFSALIFLIFLILHRDDSSSDDEAASVRLFRPGADIPPAGRQPLKTRKRKSGDAAPKKKQTPFGKDKNFDPTTKNVKKKLDPLIQAFKALGPSSKKDTDLEQVIQFEKDQARKKFEQMSAEDLVKKGSKFGMSSNPAAITTAAKKDLYIEHLARIEAYQKLNLM